MNITIYITSLRKVVSDFTKRILYTQLESEILLAKLDQVYCVQREIIQLA